MRCHRNFCWVIHCNPHSQKEQSFKEYCAQVYVLIFWLELWVVYYLNYWKWISRELFHWKNLEMQAVITFHDLKIWSQPRSSACTSYFKYCFKSRPKRHKYFALIKEIVISYMGWAWIYQKILCRLHMSHTSSLQPQRRISQCYISQSCYSYLVHHSESCICLVNSNIYDLITSPSIMIYLNCSQVSIQNWSNSCIILRSCHIGEISSKN